MPYITINDVRKLCDKIGVQQVPDAEVTEFIQKAEARIDASLGTRYRLPLPLPTPPLVKSIAEDFAASFVLDKYFGGKATKEQIPLSEVYFKRAKSDLDMILDKGLMDNLPGLSVIGPLERRPSPCMRSTTRGRSEMERALDKL